MGKRIGRSLALTGVQTASKSEAQLVDMFHDILKTGMHGICFSLYQDGQKPGDVIGEEQIRRRIEKIKPHTEWVRSFSCIEGNELIPKIAKEYGLKTLVGAWLGDDFDKNEQEIAGLLKLAQEGLVDVAAVGNEVMYRKEMSEEELIGYINNVKQAIPAIPVGYVDAYYEFSHRPKITEACDVILTNCYPFWEGCHIDYAFVYMKQMYQQALDAAKGKRVIITETGWPSEGGGFEASRAGKTNFLKYFIDAQIWSDEEDIEMFYFSSFDESWKTGDEGDVGAFWGLWDKHEVLKF
jgi:glucan 1,3-beta-glucosidase